MPIVEVTNEDCASIEKTFLPVTKIPDLLLEKLKCQCGQYLSKAPILIQDGRSICKDCVDRLAPTASPVTNNAPYEALASIFAFPCRYKQQGCNKLIKFGVKVENHELTCNYRTHNCPKSLYSTCNWEGATSQLYQHYKDEHLELCLQTPNFEFRVREDFEAYKLIDIDGALLLLQIKCDLQADKLWFNTVCFRNAEDAELISYSIKLSTPTSVNPSIFLESAKAMPITNMQMLPNKSVEVGIHAVLNILKNPEYIQCEWIINMSDQLKNKIQQILKEPNWKEEAINCPHCGVHMMPPIFYCSQGHLTCNECKGYYNECKKCQKINLEFTPAVYIEELVKSVQYTCRWVDCHQVLLYENIQQHEQSCLNRIYRCPVCYIWSGFYDKVLNHFKLEHPNEQMFKYNNSFNFYASSLNSGVGYILAHRDIFKLHFQENVIIKLWYLGSCSYVNNWEYKIKNSNVIYRLKKVNLNMYAKNIWGTNNHLQGFMFNNCSIEYNLQITKKYSD